jgi:hypothetical protein
LTALPDHLACRRSCLQKHLAQWAYILDIRDAFGQLADAFLEGLMQRRAARMLTWWQRWLQLRQQQEQLQLDTCEHMEAFCVGR